MKLNGWTIKQDENDKSGHLAKLLFRETRLQGFMYKAGGQWGKEWICREFFQARLEKYFCCPILKKIIQKWSLSKFV